MASPRQRRAPRVIAPRRTSASYLLRHLPGYLLTTALVFAAAGVAGWALQDAAYYGKSQMVGGCAGSAVVFDANCTDAAQRDIVCGAIARGSVDCDSAGNVHTVRANLQSLTSVGSFEGLKAIEYINLSGNQLTAPPMVAGLSSLRQLYLGANRLATTPDLNGLAALSVLTLDSNQLVTVPSFASFAQLQILALHGNRLTTVPLLPSQQMTTVNISSNRICGAIAQPANVTTWDASNQDTSACSAACTPESDAAFCTRLGAECSSKTGTDNCGATRTVASCGTCETGSLCSAATNTCMAVACRPVNDAGLCLVLGATCGMATGTDSCGTTRTVDCGTCPLGQVCGDANVCETATSAPMACPVAAQATALDTWLAANGKTRSDISYGCNASGHLTDLAAPPDAAFSTIPPFASFPALAKVNMQGNGMSGMLPATLPANLERLWVTGGELTGTIPPLPSTLVSLHLGNNQLTGAIPSPLPAGLTELHLFHNQLTGTIPSFATLSALKAVNLEGNMLEGPIPALPTNGALEHLQLGFNRLTGGIPVLPAGMKEFLAQENQLNGTIASPFPASLTFLWAPKNQLTGTIPPISGTQLTTFHLGNNLLTGTLPVPPPTIEGYYAFGNQLSGTAPSFASFTALTQLNIAVNQLSGTLPLLPENLHMFVATNNQFVGPIPQPYPAGISTLRADRDGTETEGVYSVYSNRICPPYPYPTDGRIGVFALEPQDTTACATAATDFQLTLRVPLEGRDLTEKTDHGTHRTTSLEVTFAQIPVGDGPIVPIVRKDLATSDAGELALTYENLAIPDGATISIGLKSDQTLRRTVLGKATGNALTIYLDDPATYSEPTGNELRGKRFLPMGDISGSGDTLNDNFVNPSDISTWIGEFRTSAGCTIDQDRLPVITTAPADLDGNCHVGAEDLSLLVRNFNARGNSATVE